MELETGDLLLFHGTTILSKILEFFGRSKYSHVGMIIKNPKFLNDKLEDGLYVLDSSYGYTPDIEDHQKKFGVQLHKLKDIVSLYNSGTIYVRKVKNVIRDDIFYEKLKEIHTVIHNKPYDLHIMDWIAAKENLSTPISINPLWKTTNRFWCSALISYVYSQLGWISDVNWSLIAPCEFSSKESHGQLLFTCTLEDEIELIN